MFFKYRFILFLNRKSELLIILNSFYVSLKYLSTYLVNVVNVLLIINVA